MQSELEHVLTHFHKAGVLSYLDRHPAGFDTALQLLVEGNKPISWRAAWLINNCMDANDNRIQPFLRDLIQLLPKSPDNLQREVLKIILQMKVDEDLEGLLFDYCIEIWKGISKQSSVRFYAFKTLVMISQKHKALSGEIVSFTQSYYTDSLSQGVKAGIYKMTRAVTKDWKAGQSLDFD